MASFRSFASLVVYCGMLFSGCSRPASTPEGAASASSPVQENAPAAKFVEPQVGVVTAADAPGTVPVGGKDITVRGTFRLPPGQELDNEDFVVQIFDAKRITHDTAMAFAKPQEDGTYAYETTIQSPLKPGTFSLESWHEGTVVVAAPLTVE